MHSHASVAVGAAVQVDSQHLQCTMHVSLEGLSAPRLRTNTQVFVGDSVADRFCSARDGLWSMLSVLLADCAC